LGSGRRIMVESFGMVNSTENVYCIGDQALQLNDPGLPKGHPQLTQVAIQQGSWLAMNLIMQVNGQEMVAFRYNRGTMAIISKFKAVVDLPKGFFKGFFACVVWLLVHILPVAAYRNKVKLALNWLWGFLIDDPTLRLIDRSGGEKRRSQYMKTNTGVDTK
jgi:NADH dehydrogenase